MEIKPDDEYFEKALLFLKPACIEKPQHEISGGADRLLTRVKEKEQKKKKHSLLSALLYWASGAAFMWLIMFIAEHAF